MRSCLDGIDRTLKSKMTLTRKELASAANSALTKISKWKRRNSPKKISTEDASSKKAGKGIRCLKTLNLRLQSRNTSVEEEKL